MLKPDTAISKIEAQVADTVVSQRIANNLIRGVMDRIYPQQSSKFVVEIIVEKVAVGILEDSKFTVGTS